MTALDPFAFAREDSEPADIALIAATEIEPIDVLSAFSEPAWRKRTINLGVMLQFSACILVKTKPELAAMARAFDPVHEREFIDGLVEARDDLRALADLVEVALCRQTVGLAMLASQEEAKPAA